MNDTLPAIEAWSTIRRFEDSSSTARASRRSSVSSSDASEYSTFSYASDVSSATSASAASSVSWRGTNTNSSATTTAAAAAATVTGASQATEQKQFFGSSQHSDFSDEGYGSSSSQSSDGHLSEAFLESLDLGHPTGTSYFRRPNLPGVNTCIKAANEQLNACSAFSSQPQQDSCPSLVQPIPRRTSASNSWSRPSLVRQTDRRLDFVEHLVDSATQLVALIWPQSATSSAANNRKSGNSVIPLRIFIRETLRRSRTSYSTLQVTLYYLVLIKKKGGLPQCGISNEALDNASSPPSPSSKALQCGRRMFLAGLILASKYLQDRNFSARAWSKISGLQVKEININEMAFLDAINWKLHMKITEFNEWSNKVSECTEAAQRGRACPWAKIMEDVPPAQDETSSAAVLEAPPTGSQSKTSLPSDLEPIDSWTKTSLCGDSLSAPTSRRSSWAPRQLSCDNMSLNSRSSTPSTLEPQCQVAPPAPSNLWRNLCTPQFTPWTASSSSLSTPAESVQSQFSACAPTSSAYQVDRTRCVSWLARQSSVSSRNPQTRTCPGYSGASHRWTYPPTAGMATTTPTTGLPSLCLDKTPSLVTSPRSMSSSEDQSSNASFLAESSELVQGYPSPPMTDDGPISPTRSETSRIFLRSAEEVSAMPKPAFFPPRLPALQSSRSSSLLSLMQHQTSSSSSASNTPTPTSFITTSTSTHNNNISRGIKRRNSDNHTMSNNGPKYAKFVF